MKTISLFCIYFEFNQYQNIKKNCFRHPHNAKSNTQEWIGIRKERFFFIDFQNIYQH